MILNPILASDSYKFSHYAQYPQGMRFIKSYITARGSKIPGVTAVVIAGVQIFVHEVLMKRIKRNHIAFAEQFCAKHGVPFNKADFEIIVAEHGGFWPVELRSAPEGTPVPLNELMVSLQNTDERFPWVTSFLETLLLSYVWYASTVATKSREIKKVIKRFLDMSSDAPDAELPFKLHDFGYRGAAPGAAGVGGFAHLINFMGTDTVAGIEYAMEYYDADVCGYSISASEHSTMTSWTREGEYNAYLNMVKQYAKPGAIFACVIDSYDTFNAIRLWCYPQNGNPALVDMVKAAGATVVLRPDSGDPVMMPVLVIEEIAKYTNFKNNSKNYKVLPDHIRVIQGDGIDKGDLEQILIELDNRRISASNIAFGMGGGLLQKVDRDTFKFAMKACRGVQGDRVVPIVKDPVTDTGKRSKQGDLALAYNTETGEYKTIDLDKETLAFEGPWVRKDQIVYRHYRGETTFNPINMETVRKNAAL